MECKKTSIIPIDFKEIDTFSKWLSGVVLYKQADSNATDVSEAVLRRCILCSSDKSLEEIARSYPPCSEERNYLIQKISEIRQNGNADYAKASLSGLDKDISAFLYENYTQQSTFDLLLSYIHRAGYRKASDFYKDIPDGDSFIDADRWYKYKSGRAVFTDAQMIIMFFMLKLDYYEAQYLFNSAGKTFLPNNKLHVIVLYFLKNGYTNRSGVTYEEGLMQLDETLEHFGEKPIYSLE